MNLKSNVEAPTFLSTHTLLKKRMKNMKNIAKSLPFIALRNTILDEIWK
jgi:predicted Zn-dependent protease